MERAYRKGLPPLSQEKASPWMGGNLFERGDREEKKPIHGEEILFLYPQKIRGRKNRRN